MTFKELQNLIRSKLNLSHTEARLPSGHAGDKGQLDQYSPTWIFIRNWLEIELQKARETNDYLKNDETRTAALRGRIKLLKEILGLSNKEGR